MTRRTATHRVYCNYLTVFVKALCSVLHLGTLSICPCLCFPTLLPSMSRLMPLSLFDYACFGYAIIMICIYDVHVHTCHLSDLLMDSTTVYCNVWDDNMPTVRDTASVVNLGKIIGNVLLNL